MQHLTLYSWHYDALHGDCGVRGCKVSAGEQRPRKGPRCLEFPPMLNLASWQQLSKENNAGYVSLHGYTMKFGMWEQELSNSI